MTGVELVLTVGLPGSGKSTWARAWRDAGPRRCLVTRDSLRMSLFGCLAPLPDENEELLSDVQPVMVRAALQAGWSVCVDDTNLREERRVALVTVAASGGAPVRVVDFRRVPREVVLAQNAKREGTPAFVPVWVIDDMASRYGIWTGHPLEEVP